MLKASLLMFNIFLFLLHICFKNFIFNKQVLADYFSRYKKCFTEIIF